MRQLLMGNEAIALAALDAGVQLCAGYPGTPSSEILETVARERSETTYVEWSVNEKAALEIAAAASLAGARALVTMKQVGSNVALDPLMSLRYLGVKGGLVLVIADDPGPVSSQTEQDSRTLGLYSKVPVLDPSGPEEAYEMTRLAFERSEAEETPVIVRPVTRICHGKAVTPRRPAEEGKVPERLAKEPSRVIFPSLSRRRHALIEDALLAATDDPMNGTVPYPVRLPDTPAPNFARGTPFIKENRRCAVLTQGSAYGYTLEACRKLRLNELRILRIGAPFPFPSAWLLEQLAEVDELLVLEELDPYLERETFVSLGRAGRPLKVSGKMDGLVPRAGELSTQAVLEALSRFLDVDPTAARPVSASAADFAEQAIPAVGARPPVLCPGCPHRASFYAVKQVMRKREAVFCGDIGCYTLGNAAPLEMTDTCLCMGAGITMAQGFRRVLPDQTAFAFIGDSTFFASGLPGIANAVYTGTPFVLMILDNSTTAMTGHQTHPGLGRTLMGEREKPLNIAGILEAMGVEFIRRVNPFRQDELKRTVNEAVEHGGVAAVLCEAPCIFLHAPDPAHEITDDCINCGACIRGTGCPALRQEKERVEITADLCNGCGLCATVCPVLAIVPGKEATHG